MEGTLKACSLCGERKPLQRFHRRGRNIPALDSWCRDCRRKKTEAWAKSNPEKKRASGMGTRLKYRTTVIEHYGGACACCGEQEMMFLAIDHIGGGGTKHRASLGDAGRGSTFYRWLTKQGFPPGYRVLCHNCNMAIGFYGSCPHERGRNHGRDA